ncbi:MAG TPA: carboxypeptidase-like regulatory domain-containing protein, partial [Planctomycetota bacterium]|nr:carboxypeptidase-like regulatory domain-containing protein [Planctomycetota bacterium]
MTRFGGASLFFSGPGEIDRSTDRTAKTDKEGRFEFLAVAPYSMYTLLADHESYASVERGPLDTTGGAVIEQELVLGDGARLFGQIKDTQGNSVGNARVVLTPTALGAIPGEEGLGRREVQSDAGGRYEFLHCAKGPHVLTISADGYGQATIQNLVVTGEDAMERNVELDVAQLMGGRVLDQAGAPIEGAKIDAFLIANRATRTQTSTLSNKDGAFEFQDVVAGSYTLRADAKGYKVATVNRVNAGEMNIEIQLLPLPTVSGQVFDSNGDPVTQYTINLRTGVQNSDLSMLVGGSRIQVKDPEGRYSMTLPQAGQFLVEATTAGYAPSLSNSFTASDGQNLTGINVQLSTGGTIRGRLVAQDGTPIAGASVKTENNEWTGGGFDLSLGESFPGMSTKKTAK